MKYLTMSNDLDDWLGIPVGNGSVEQPCTAAFFLGFEPNVSQTVDKVSNILDICVNVIILSFLLSLCFCSSNERCIRRRTDLSKVKLQKKLPKKYGYHSLRYILVLIQCITWCLNVGEVSLRRIPVQEDTSLDLKPLMLAAPFTSLLSTGFSLVFYSCMERVGAHCVYLVFSQVLWAAQTVTSSARIFEMVCLLCVTFSSVAPCIYSFSAFVSACLLFLDTATIVEWFVIERHKQSVDLNPERRDRIPSSPICKKPNGKKSNSLFLKSRRRSPPSQPTTETVINLNPSGVETRLKCGGYGNQNEEEDENSMEKLRYDHNDAGFLSKCTFSWFLEVLRRGWERPLEFSDLDRIPDEESSKVQFERFEANFQAMKSRDYGLWRTFFFTYGHPLTVSGIFKLLGDGVNVVGPLVIAPIVTFVRKVQEGKEETQDQEVKLHMVGWREFMSNGWVLAFVALWASLLQSTFSQTSSHLLATMGIRLKCALQATIYHKILNVSTSRSHNKSMSNIEEKGSSQENLQHSLDMGHVTNLFWEDVDNIMKFFMSCHYLWAIPLKLLVLVGLLYLQMGISAVAASLIAVILLLPIQFILAKGFVVTSKKISESGDRRSSIINEVVLFIRTVKMLALNTLFLRKVKEVREEELKHLLKESLLRALMAFLMQASSILTILLAFGFYAFLEEEPPDEGVIFSSLALFSQFTVPLFVLPHIVAQTMKAKRSVFRLQEFFALPEVPSGPLNNPEKNYEETQAGLRPSGTPGKAVVEVDNATFSYGKDPAESVLKNLSFRIPEGKLTVVVGGVGSGKSSLLLSLLGELNLQAGKVRWERSGSVAYVSQTPWLLNCSLKKNILMGKGFLSRRYRKVLDVCSLVPDLNLLPDGDGTEIGARGLNLSGGQRKRVTIARALYSDLPVVIMDCPFSALDATVALQVFLKVRDQLLKKPGSSSSSATFILATQHHELCAFADHVLYLEDETIRLQGTPEDIARRRPDLCWGQGTSSSLCTGSSPDGGVELGLKEERKSLQRRMTRKDTRRKHLIDELSMESISCPSARRHTDWSRFSPLQLLLQSEEMDFFPVSVSTDKYQPPKAPIFRTLSSSPSFGRLDEAEKTRFDRRLARSLPSRPMGPKPRLRDKPDGRKKFKREDSVFQKLFSSPSVRSRQTQMRAKKDRWNSRIWSFLSQRRSQIKEEGKDSDEDSGEESEASDSDVCETLIDDEERERGTISKWNYFSYLEACGVTLGAIYIVSLILNQGALISLDVWLGYWSKMCGGSNYSIPEKASERSLNASFDSLGEGRAPPSLSPTNETAACSTSVGGQHLLVFGLLSVLAAFTGLFTVCLAQVAAHRGRRKLFEEMVKAVVAARVKFFDVTPIGRILNRFNTDILLIDKELGWSMMQFMYFSLLCGSTLVVNGIVSPLFLIFSVPLVFLYYILQHIFRATSIELKRLETLSRSPVMSLITETGDGPAVIRAYGIQSRFRSCFFRRLDGHLSSCILFHAGNRWLGICLDYFGGVMVFLSTVTCLIGSTTGFGYLLTPMTVGMAIKYTLSIPAYLNWLVRFLTETETGLNSVERVGQYIRLTPESQGESLYSEMGCQEKNCKCRKTLKDSLTPEWLSIRDGSSLNIQAKPTEFALQFRNVSLYYDKRGNPVLSDVSFKLRRGEKVGVCGRTGSGKSSLLMGLLRMVDRQDGSIFIHDSDIRCTPLEDLRKHVSIVPQEIHMFSGSIRFNLDPENDSEDEELWRALELVHMKKFVSLLPQKIDTQIVGHNFLSAGQTQLLVLARVLLEKRSIVLLDEVAAEQDLQMEGYLLKIIQQELSDSTVIMVAHSVPLLLQCDRVLSIDQGHLIEDGPPKELSSNRQGLFATLLRSANHQLEGIPVSS